MNICIPVEADNGLGSQVCAHFGAAPVLMIVATDTGSTRAIVNGNRHHRHGMCKPLQSLQGEQIDGAVVGGIGAGALDQFNAANIPVYAAEHATVGVVLAAFRSGRVNLLQTASACAHHGERKGCH
jgi:predicted Fe-Mo cluster-binding NifX family protein